MWEGADESFVHIMHIRTKGMEWNRRFSLVSFSFFFFLELLYSELDGDRYIYCKQHHEQIIRERAVHFDTMNGADPQFHRLGDLVDWLDRHLVKYTERRG